MTQPDKVGALSRVCFLLFMPVALKFNLCVYTLVEKVGVVVTYPEKGRKKPGPQLLWMCVIVAVCFLFSWLLLFCITSLQYGNLLTSASSPRHNTSAQLLSWNPSKLPLLTKDALLISHTHYVNRFHIIVISRMLWIFKWRRIIPVILKNSQLSFNAT